MPAAYVPNVCTPPADVAVGGTGTNTRPVTGSAATECAFAPVGMFAIHVFVAASMTPRTGVNTAPVLPVCEMPFAVQSRDAV
jgi:hypothetical protein